MLSRRDTEAGLTNSNTIFSMPFSLYTCLCRLAIQVGSINAFREVGCSVHVSPRSVVVAMVRPFTSSFPRLRLSRIFNMIDPSDNSTAIHSVVFLCAGLLVVHVLPPSLLHVILENDLPVSSRPCVGNTNVPSDRVIPCPGAGANNHHSFFLIWVIFTGSLQVNPSSVLFVIRNCAVSLTPNPGWEPFACHWCIHRVLSSVIPSTHLPVSRSSTPCIHNPAM